MTVTTTRLPLLKTQISPDGRLLWSGFQSLVTLTLTLDRVIHVVHQSSTSIYIPNFIEIGKTLRTGISPLMLLGRLRGVDLITDSKRQAVNKQPHSITDDACNNHATRPTYLWPRNGKLESVVLAAS